MNDGRKMIRGNVVLVGITGLAFQEVVHPGATSFPPELTMFCIQV